MTRFSYFFVASAFAFTAQVEGSNTIFNADEDPALAGTGWNATGGSHPDPTPLTSTDPASWGGSGGILNASAATGDDWMGITTSYTFDGVDDRFADVSLEAYNTLIGTQPTTQDFSVDIYFSPSDLTEVGVLWETGGTGAGSGIVQDGNEILISAAQNATNQSGLTLDLNALSPVVDAWYLLRVSIDPTNSLTASVTDGSGAVISATTSFSGTDWAGGNGTGLGSFDGNIGGDVNATLSAPLIAAGGDPTIGGSATRIDVLAESGAWSVWGGQVGLVEYAYGDMANFELVPEPSQTLFLGLGLIALGLRRRR